MATDYKQIIIDSLEVLRKRDLANKAPFGARAYANVISQLKTTSNHITKYEDTLIITGIGEKIKEKIKEIIETGTLASAERARKEYNMDAFDAFQKIYGVGPTKAVDLVNAGYSTIEELRDAVKTNPKLLNDKQKIGLRFYEDLLERIPRVEMEEHRDILHTLLPDEMEDYETEIVGSFRRGAESSGDIDVLIRMPHNVNSNAANINAANINAANINAANINAANINAAKEHLALYVKMLEGFGYITHILALGEHKCMAICNIFNGKSRRLDLLLTPDEEYAYALLYFTGSDRFNVAFRQYALNKGYSLNEHTLTPIRAGVKEVPYMKTEKDIFQFLDLRYIEPSKRVDGNQIISIKSRPRVAIN
jgi:DNA polymerase beta